MKKYALLCLGLLCVAACAGPPPPRYVADSPTIPPTGPRPCIYQGRAYPDAARIEPADMPGTVLRCADGYWETHRERY